MSEQTRTYDCRVYGCDNRVAAKWDACEDCSKPQAPHTCPFAEEIRGDTTTLCTCSRDAEHECAMDI